MGKKDKKKVEVPEKKGKREREIDSDDSDQDEEKAGDNDEDEELEEVVEEEMMGLEPTGDEEEVDAEFGFFDFIDGDFHMVRRLLQTYLEGSAWAVQDLADKVVAQDLMGSSIKVMEEEEVLGFATMVNFTRHRKEQCFVDIAAHVMKKCPKEAKEYFDAALKNDKKPLMLLLNERMINVPPVLAPHLQCSLFEDLKWAQGHKELTAEEKEDLKFDTVLYITTLGKPRSGGKEKEKEKEKKKARTEESTQGLGKDGFIYLKAEDEVYAELATAKFTYQFQIVVNKEGDLKPSDDNMTTHRMVMLIDKKRLYEARSRFKVLADKAGMGKGK